MKSRREFLKEAATGAVLLVRKARWAGRGVWPTRGKSRQETGKSKVVVAVMRGCTAQARCRTNSGYSICSTRRWRRTPGAKNRWTPGSALFPQISWQPGDRLKVNGLGGRGISTHAVLVLAIAERLQQAGAHAGNIIVWDRNARDLQACGLTISTESSRVRCFGSDVAGFEDEQAVWARADSALQNPHRECAMVINLPILKTTIWRALRSR